MFVEFDPQDWDKVASKALNYNFYQSTQYAKIFEKVYGTKTKCFMLLDENEKVKASGIAIVKENQMAFEFGPLVYSETKPSDVKDFLNYVQDKYPVKIKFTLNKQFMDKFSDVEKIPTYFSF